MKFKQHLLSPCYLKIFHKHLLRTIYARHLRCTSEKKWTKISALIKFYIVVGEEKKENKYNEHVNYILG